MQNKNLKILAVIFVILNIFLAVRTYLPRFTPATSAYTEKIKGLNKTAIQSVSIKNTTETIDLQKENNTWKINSKKADTEKVENIINQLLVTVSPELVAQTDKRHKEFDLTDDMATKVALDNKLTWFIGKGSGSAVYARFDGNNDVYLLKDISLTALSSASDWYDKTILKFDQTKATKISFTEGNKTITLTKKDDTWIDTQTKEAKKDKVDSVLSQASGLNAQTMFDASLGATYPKAPSLTMVIEYEGKSETLEFYKGSSDYLVKRVSDGEQFVVSEYSISTIISAPKDVI